MLIIELYKEEPTKLPTSPPGGIWEVGPIYATRKLNKETGAKQISVSRITFPPGCRTSLHTHETVQVLYILEGQGILATETVENEVYPGTIVYVPPGERHWHGATENSFMTHLSITPILD